MPFAPAAAAAAWSGVSVASPAPSEVEGPSCFMRLPSPRARRTAFICINATVLRLRQGFHPAKAAAGKPADRRIKEAR